MMLLLIDFKSWLSSFIKVEIFPDGERYTARTENGSLFLVKSMLITLASL